MKSIFFLILFMSFIKINANEITTDKIESDWESKKVIIGFGGGLNFFSTCIQDDYGIMDCRLNNSANEIHFHYIMSMFQFSFYTGLYDRIFLNYDIENFTHVYTSILAGLNLFYKSIRWYLEGGMIVVFNPFYYGPVISTGIEWLFLNSLAIGIKVNGKYLMDTSKEGNAYVYHTDGGQPAILNDTHAELELLLTASYVFGTK